MRFGVVIVALLACEVAHAQTPLPRARPHAPSDAAAHADHAKPTIKIAFAAPIPRARPSEAPASKHAVASVPDKSQTHIAVPMPRERPVAAMKRIVDAVLAATSEEAKTEARATAPKSDPVAASPSPSRPAAKSEGARPSVAAPAPKEAIARAETPAPGVTAPVESPLVVPGQGAVANATSPAIMVVPLGTERAAPDAGPPGGRDDAPMEEPVPPLPSPPAATPPQITRLEPKQATPPAAVTPPTSVELPKLSPPPADHDTQVAQLPPSLVAFLKKLPIPKKRPLSAWPRPDDTVFRDVTGNSPEGECDAALNSGILVAERLQLGRRGGCFVPHAVRVEAIMVGRKRIDIMPPAKLRCGFALAIANWVRSDFAPAAEALGANFVGLRQLDSYNCRTMSSTRRLMSEHSAGNALDIAEVVLAGHHRAHLTDRSTQRGFRARLRATACKRFKTVLGPGVPQHHDHIHVDLRKHYGPGGICHWNVL